MWQAPEPLRRAGRQLAAGLVALGQCLGAHVPAECYDIAPTPESAGDTPGGRTARTSRVTGTARSDRTAPADGRTPPPGHPERLVPVSELSGPKWAAWRRLEELWERDASGAENSADAAGSAGPLDPGL
ncbi:hypothetical protein [Streptomyces sp. NPDC047108]|uniref:DUF6059 family protein n=1 Tax=Streptomyces sp. NPDC047108 TaxID=3155025 RepID=UPI00340F339B